jgi:fibronectin-binding autotransporter adhesin
MHGIRGAGQLVRRVGWRGLGAVVVGAGAVTGASLLMGGSAVGAPTCTINFNKVAGGDFFTIANWNDAITPTTHRVPGTTDYACVAGTTTGAVTFSTGTSKTIKGIDAEGTGGFALTAGTLTISDAANDTTIKNISIAGGTLAGAGNAVFTGTGTWDYGTLSGTGSVTVPSGSTVNVSSTACYPILGRSLTNHGTIAITGNACGGLYLSTSKTLTNASDGTIDIQADTAINNWDASAVSIANSGTIKKTTGSGNSTVNVNVTNSGASVSYQATIGTILLTTSDNSATIGGSGNLDLGTTFNVTGATTFSSGPLVKINGATIDGTANLTFNGAVTWNYGTMQGAGNTTVSTTGTIAVPSAACYPVLSRSLTNHGTITIFNGGCGGMFFGLSATLTNASDGTIDLQDSGTTIGNWDASSPTLSNAGIIKRSSGSGTSTINVAVTSTSTNGLRAQVGTLSLAGGGTISGSTSASAGAVLSLDTTAFAVNGATFGGAGTTQVLNTTVNLTGATTVSSLFQLTGGIIDGAGTLALNGGGTWDYGTLQGAGTTTVAAGTSLLLPDTNCHPVLLRPLTNHGTITIASGGCAGLYVGNNATLTNASDGVIDLQGGTSNIGNWDATTPAISNAGIIKKSTGAGYSGITIPVTSTSTNGLQSQTGVLALGADSTISGSTSASAGATVSLEGAATFAVNGATFGGAGTTRVANATVNLTGTTTISSAFQFTGGTIDGAGALALNGGGTWDYGTMQGAGTTTIGAGSTLLVPNANCYATTLRPFTNHGTLTVANGGCTGFYVGNGALLTNASDGVIDLQGSVTIGDWDTSGQTISNAGVIKHSSGNVVVTITISTTNTATGELRADAGTLAMTTLTNVSGSTVTDGKYTATGSGNVQLPIGGTGKLLTNAAIISMSGLNSKLSSPTAANALVSIATNSGSLSISNGRLLSTNAASFANSGTVNVGDGAVASTFTVAGPYTQSAGTTTVAALSTLTPTASTVTVSGGTLNGGGTVSRPVATSGTGTVQNAAATPLALGSGYSGTGKVKTAITSASVYDKINVTGTATLTGSTLALSTDVGYVPATGATFTIMTCSTACTGPFSSVTGATMLDGAFYTVTYNPTSVVLTVVRNADVSITNADSNDPVKADVPAGPHTSLTYTVTVSNAGPGPANNVVVTDTLPAHVIVTSVPGSCTGAGVVKTCSLGTIPSGSNVVLSFVMKPPSPETLTNTASSTSDTPDTNSANNTNVSQTTLVNAQLNTQYVNVDDGVGGVSYDTPALVLKKLGNTVQFNFWGTASHRLLSNEGTIDTGVMAPATGFSAVIRGSGIYSYHDTLAAQVVTGKITAKPTYTGTGTSRTVTWASAAPAAGYAFDVKVKTPTGTVTYATGTTATGGVYNADQGPGKYIIQVRLRRLSDSVATGFAKAKAFTI